MSTSNFTIRSLHYVFKIGDRNATAAFYKEILGMKILRHEEFTEGCEATCNGPYSGKWSKTMVGYGPEDSHFVCELTYNYGIAEYKRGNSFMGLFLDSPAVAGRASPPAEGGDRAVLTAPDGNQFWVAAKEEKGKDPVVGVALASSDLDATRKFWGGLLGLQTLAPIGDHSQSFSCGPGQVWLEFRKVDAVVHAKAGGRIAFSVPADQLATIEAKVKAAGGTILTPLISLPTPGKATVQVVILADPDGHEICFVGDEAFRELSAVDPGAGAALDAAIEGDKSGEWFGKRGGKGVEQ